MPTEYRKSEVQRNDYLHSVVFEIHENGMANSIAVTKFRGRTTSVVYTLIQNYSRYSYGVDKLITAEEYKAVAELACNIIKNQIPF